MTDYGRYHEVLGSEPARRSTNGVGHENSFDDHHGAGIDLLGGSDALLLAVPEGSSWLTGSNLRSGVRAMMRRSTEDTRRTPPPPPTISGPVSLGHSDWRYGPPVPPKTKSRTPGVGKAKEK